MPVEHEPVLRVAWDDFIPRFRWNQGEHVALVGPTGQGKTTLALKLLQLRVWRVIFASKPQDKTLRGLTGRKGGFTRITAWPPPNDRITSVLLWPKWHSRADNGRQAAAFRNAIDRIYREKAWCIFADDVQHLTEELRLGSDLQTLWIMARSLNISLMAATQRPRHVPNVMWNQSTHLFIWGTQDEDDLKRLGGLGGLSAKRIRHEVAQLEDHDVLYINTRSRQMCVTRSPRG